METITAVVDHDDVKVWEVALRHHAPEVWVNDVFGPHGDGYQVTMIRSAGSLEWDRRFKRSALLTFYTPGDHPAWRMLAECRGRVLRVVAYRAGGTTNS